MTEACHGYAGSLVSAVLVGEVIQSSFHANLPSSNFIKDRQL